MKIYITHSTAFDFKKELYEPLRSSKLNTQYEIVLPHEKSEDQFNSKDYMKNCGLIIAEVSYPSTGQGIELGWSNLYKINILCIFKKGSKPSGALKAVSDNIIEYKNPKDMLDKINNFLKEYGK